MADDLTTDQQSDFEEAFKVFDRDNDGSCSFFFVSFSTAVAVIICLVSQVEFQHGSLELY